MLENPTGKPDKDGMATLVAELHEVIRANTPDEREYKRYMDGIKNSVLTAFYTPPKVADAIVEAIWDTRIVPKRILDPSAGTGVFVNAVDFHDPYAEITCFEKDPATGLILKHLHPEKRVRVQGFERIEPKYAGYYDVAVSNIPFGDVALFDPFFSTHTDPVRRQGTRALHQLFFHEVRRYGTRGRPGGIHHLAGSIERRAGTPRARVADEPLRARIGHPAPNNLFTEHAGTEVGSDLVILQKKAATGELSERQRDFIESRKLSNGIRINNLFQSFDRVIHTEAKVGKDPYGKPAMEFTHAEGVDGIDREMRRMLSEDFNRHFNESYCLEHAPEQTPGTPERELSRSRQAERQRAERYEPRLAGEIVKEIIADARNLQQQREEEEKRRVVAEMAAQGYHVDTETGEITRIENKPGQVLPGILPPHPPENRPERIWPTSGPGRRSGRIACGSSTRRNPKISAWRILPCSTWAEQRNRNRGRLRRVAFRHGGNGGCRTGKRAAGTVADALRPVRLQRRGAAAGRTPVYPRKGTAAGEQSGRRPGNPRYSPRPPLRRNRRAKCRKRRHRSVIPKTCMPP